MGQTFFEFVRSYPQQLRPRYTRICVVPLGDLSATQQSLLSDTADYLGRFFGFPVECLTGVPLGVLPGFEYDRDKSFRKWLRTITLNIWRNHCRQSAGWCCLRWESISDQRWRSGPIVAVRDS